jgi:uncharacterized protein YjeT (DUF2065 family)
MLLLLLLPHQAGWQCTQQQLLLLRDAGLRTAGMLASCVP